MSNQQDLSLFERYLIEAPGDEAAPDANMDASNDATSTDNPPDAPAEDPPAIDGTPGDDNAGDFTADDPGGEDPPDMDDFSTDDMGDMSDDESNNDDAPTGLDTKVSAIMNQTLYKRYLSLLNQIASQQTSIKNNSDILYTISADVAGIVKSLSKLEENIRSYLKNTFADENYSRNLLFFNKAINLFKLLDDSFDAIIREGMEQQKHNH